MNDTTCICTAFSLGTKRGSRVNLSFHYILTTILYVFVSHIPMITVLSLLFRQKFTLAVSKGNVVASAIIAAPADIPSVGSSPWPSFLALAINYQSLHNSIAPRNCAPCTSFTSLILDAGARLQLRLITYRQCQFSFQRNVPVESFAW